KCAVAYIVGETPINVEMLNRFIEEELPPYMVPAATMQVETIPLTPNGKVDRRKLPAPDFSAGEEDEGARPLNDLEKQISCVVAEILGHEGFSVSANLMRAGLTSLSCIKLAAKLDDKLGVSPTVRQIMAEPTLLGIENALIALLLSRNTTPKAQPKAQELRPLSQSQMGLYYECVKNPAALIYNIPVCLTLGKETDIPRLEKAISAIAQAHPALRARLQMQGDTVWQKAVDDAVACETVAVTEADMPAIKTAFVRPFRLFDEALFRAQICVTEAQIYLLLDFHHIVFDGASLDIFLQELAEAYDDPNKPLEGETTTCFDVAQEEKDGEEGAEYLAAKAFFDSMMSGSEGATQIPYDEKDEGHSPLSAAPTSPLREGGSGPPETVSVTVEKESLASGLETLGVTPASLFLGATAFVSGRFGGAKNVGLAAVSTGRNSAALRRTMGMFVKTLPLVFDLDSAQTAADYLRRAQETMYGAMAHEAYPYTRVASEYRFYPQILFAYQGALLERHELGGKPLYPESLGLDTVKFPIDISVEEEDGAYRLAVEYDASRFARHTMETFSACIAHMTRQFAAAGACLLGKFSIADEKQMALVNSFSAAIEPPLARAVHELFERQVVKTPDALALQAADGDFTYAQLNARANRIARALLDKGANKGDKIAFVLGRTSHVFAAIYGILKAGCAFIPVDPTYPRERIAHILSDSDARFIVTDGRGEYPNGLDINDLLAHDCADNPNIAVGPEDLCYVIYTSGSTGKPKGVMLAHRGITNYASPFARNLECVRSVEQGNVYVSVTTHSFDAFLFDIFVPLSNGLRVVLASEEEVRNPVLLARLCGRTGVNAISTTPSVILQYLEIPEMRAAVAGFSTLIIGAEKFPESLYKSLRAVTEGAIFNSYGPTEATVDCNCKIVT
ncbi:MAG: AMP-binding protein, partial [Clostridiales bacterium]|nr:AMP-binding protein [Clostridiales bacterium]